MSAAAPFNTEALATNRAGRLTPGQLENLRRYDRGTGGNSVAVAVFCVILAVVLFTSRSPAANAWLRPFAGVAALVIAGLLVLRRLGLGGRLAADLNAGRVEAIEGAILKRGGMGTGQNRSRVLQVGGETFKVFSGSYAAAPDAGIVRLYYLPKSRHVVNLEQLPDRALPEGVLDSPMQAMKGLSAALLSHDPVRRAEAAASAAALRNSIGMMGADAVPPPPTDRDRRPLGESILGKWQNGLFALTFSPDGTVTLRMAGGVERSGRWSVDSEGRLHTDATGSAQIADSWIVGDALTISAQEGALTFRRA